MSQLPLKVAVPWSLSHYIPSNGFHPLYRALFDHAPTTIELSAWDNVKLYHRFRSDLPMRTRLVKQAEGLRVDRVDRGAVAQKHKEYFWPPNQALTAELPGDIEFHHTAPFPSFKRPFIFHCESFAPVLLPFAHQGSGTIDNPSEIREYFRNIFANPLCLGIFSHIPDTLQTFRQFFSDPMINRKLFPSKIGLSEKAFHGFKPLEKPSLSRPRFLFVNSASQNTINFFYRGGHLVLRFWKEFIASGRDGLLILRCAKPCDADLLEHGVDITMLQVEMGRSIIWAQDYLSNHEMNVLLASTHFFLLPSASLHSVSILQAMALGTLPVVSDSVGTSVYVTDDIDGIVLEGVRKAFWFNDEVTGILVDQYRRVADLDDSLVAQLLKRVGTLLEDPGMYRKMQSNMVRNVSKNFSGQDFSDDFWTAVSQLSAQALAVSSPENGQGRSGNHFLSDCTIRDEEWARVFESPIQAMVRVNTRQGIVWELGGAMIHAYGNPRVELNDWSVLAQYYSFAAPALTFAKTLEELNGKYFTFVGGAGERFIQKLIYGISRSLKPFPSIHRNAVRIYSSLPRYLRRMKAKTTIIHDCQILHQGVSGYNVLRHKEHYYAIPQDEGEFDLEKIKSGGYSSCFSANTVEQIFRDIAESSHTFRPMSLETTELIPVHCIVEGFHGFNIFQQENEWFAILQHEGEFSRAKLLAKLYNPIFWGSSGDEVQGKILSSLNGETPQAMTEGTFVGKDQRSTQGPQ